MVAAPRPQSDGDSADHGDEAAAYFDEMQERWPAERPSRRRAKRAYRRKEGRRIVVRSERLPEPDLTRMSKALLEAQRELGLLQAERDARDDAAGAQQQEAADG